MAETERMNALERLQQARRDEQRRVQRLHDLLDLLGIERRGRAGGDSPPDAEEPSTETSVSQTPESRRRPRAPTTPR